MCLYLFWQEISFSYATCLSYEGFAAVPMVTVLTWDKEDQFKPLQ